MTVTVFCKVLKVRIDSKCILVGVMKQTVLLGKVQVKQEKSAFSCPPDLPLQFLYTVIKRCQEWQLNSCQ